MGMCAGVECCSLNPVCSLVGSQVGFVAWVGVGVPMWSIAVGDEINE